MKNESLPFFAKLLSGIAFLCLIITFFVYYASPRLFPTYTVGTLQDVFQLGEIEMVRFTFSVNGETYEGQARRLDGMDVPGGRHLVQFFKGAPERCLLVPDREVPDSLKVIPGEGWETVPF